MVSPKFDACVPHIFREEGGLSLVRSDPGNWTGGKVGAGELRGTNFGIAASSHPTLDIRALTQAEAAAIYRREYWTLAGCELLPAGTDLSIFDVSVNSGVARGRAYRNQTADVNDAVTRVKRIADIRTSFYKGLTSFKTFGKGWLARVARCEAASIAMALASIGFTPSQVKKQLDVEAANAKAKASKAGKKAGTAGAGGAGAAASPAALGDVTPDFWPYVLVAVIVVLVAGVAFYLHRKRAHDQRVIALKEAARAV